MKWWTLGLFFSYSPTSGIRVNHVKSLRIFMLNAYRLQFIFRKQNLLIKKIHEFNSDNFEFISSFYLKKKENSKLGLELPEFSRYWPTHIHFSTTYVDRMLRKAILFSRQ